MKKVLAAGAISYLGRYIFKELKNKGYWIRPLARKPEKLEGLKGIQAKELFVEKLKVSGLDYAILRPSGFFSDILGFFSSILTMDVVGDLYGKKELKGFFEQKSLV